jgi:hypothetical protein
VNRREPLSFSQCQALSDHDRLEYELYLGREAPLEEARRYLVFFGSYERTDHMVMVMRAAGWSERWDHCLSIFLAAGNMCDAPWPWRSELAGVLRDARSGVAEDAFVGLLDPEAREWWSNLPPLIPVYRGCQRGRERGIHWSTNRAVAEGFARGKRCVNPNPTLVQAVIPKGHIFGVFADRNEDEVALDPRRLRRVLRVELTGLKPYL